MGNLTAEQRQIRLEELRLLEANPTHQLLLTRLQVLHSNKRREQREAAFSNDTAKTHGCEWALWGLEQVQTILNHLRDETKERTEITR